MIRQQKKKSVIDTQKNKTFNVCTLAKFITVSSALCSLSMQIAFHHYCIHFFSLTIRGPQGPQG